MKILFQAYTILHSRVVWLRALNFDCDDSHKSVVWYLTSLLIIKNTYLSSYFLSHFLEKMMVSEEFPGFVGSTCWIQGVYVYRELNLRNDDVAYYGITKDIDIDGKLESGQLCKTFDRLEGLPNEGCTPLQKTFFQQVIILFNVFLPFKEDCKSLICLTLRSLIC